MHESQLRSAKLQSSKLVHYFFLKIINLHYLHPTIALIVPEDYFTPLLPTATEDCKFKIMVLNNKHSFSQKNFNTRSWKN